MIRTDLLTKLAKPISLEDLGIPGYERYVGSPADVLSYLHRSGRYRDLSMADVDGIEDDGDVRASYKPIAEKFQNAGVHKGFGRVLQQDINLARVGDPYRINDEPDWPEMNPEDDPEWQAIARKRIANNIATTATHAAGVATVGSLALRHGWGVPMAASVPLGLAAGAFAGYAKYKDPDWIAKNKEELSKYQKSLIKSTEFKDFSDQYGKYLARNKDIAMQDADEAIRVYKELEKKPTNPRNTEYYGGQFHVKNLKKYKLSPYKRNFK